MAASRNETKAGGPVALDPDSITPDGAGYRARLTGNLDASWIRTYLTLWTGSNFFSRFHLEILRDGSADVQFEILQQSLAEILRLSRHFIFARRKLSNRVVTGVIAGR